MITPLISYYLAPTFNKFISFVLKNIWEVSINFLSQTWTHDVHMLRESNKNWKWFYRKGDRLFIQITDFFVNNTKNARCFWNMIMYCMPKQSYVWLNKKFDIICYLSEGSRGKMTILLHEFYFNNLQIVILCQYFLEKKGK